MKTTLIFTAVIFFAAWMGCSDNLSLNDPLNMDNHSGQTSQTKNPGSHDAGSVELAWEQKELVVKSTSAIMENKATYTIPPLEMGPYSYMIVFDGYTNAERFTNGYAPLAKISKDEEVVFEGMNERSINGSHEIRLDNIRANEITFYAALFQVDNGNRRATEDREPSNTTVLKLSDIKIFRIN